MPVQPKVALSRVHVKPTKWTFEAHQVRRVVMAIVGDGKGWADPTAGRFTGTEFTNDLDPASPAKDHMEAVEWLRRFETSTLRGVVIDPPFSPTQKKRAYESIGAPLSKQACDASWWAALKDEAARIVKPGGRVICCGWNSNGLSRSRGFRLEAVHLFPSGGMHNDLIVTIETKVNGMLQTNVDNDQQEGEQP